MNFGFLTEITILPFFRNWNFSGLTTYSHAYSCFEHIIYRYSSTYIILIHLIMFHSISYFIYVFVHVLITVYVSSHSNVILLISCHAIYIFLSLILCFMPVNTFEVDTGKNCMYPKVLSLYKTMISICMTQTELL